MLINSQLALEVLAAWEADQNHPARSRSKKPTPSEKDISILLDTTFKASLLREEGRTVTTCVTWISQTEFSSNEMGRMRDSRLTLEFDTPISFEAYNLAKLNGIVNGKTGTLLAHRTDSEAYIWGICYFMRGTGPIGEIPATSMEIRHFRPDYLTVTITGVGSMQITRGGSVVGRIEGGKFLKSHATVLTSSMLGRYLYPLIGTEIDTSGKFKNQNDADITTSFLNCVEFIIEVLSQRRMGATVIFVPPDLKERALAEAETAWRVHGSLEFEKLQRARLKYKKEENKDLNTLGTLFRLKIDQALRHRLRSLVDLASIDGAILLTPSFEVLGFGMKLKSPKWEKEILHGPIVPPSEKQELDFSHLGTRHNSALNFVGSIKGAVAFVASSDGPIRALVRSADDIVLYWSDCRISMFAD